jgi:serine/threonine protein kinase
MVKPFKPVNFGRYLLTERIAIGGMAEIFSAKIFGAMGFEKAMVIKRILPQFAADAEFLRMFITEAKLVCHLEHPNIVQVHELGEIDGQYYISMEFVNGIDGRQLWRTLAKRKQRLPGVLALFVVAEFLKGLDYAHRAVGPDNRLLGVVHRDVSPSNILISFRGDVKIGDFGIALVQQESKTQAGVLKGKYGYMSPEQVAGLDVDHRSDIFAAGIVLAELLLGRRLFLGRSDFKTLDKVMNVRLEVLEQHEEALPPEVVRIVRLALQREPADRYQSAREFHDDILEFLFQRGERVSSETLAAFTAQHVAPFLTRKGDASTSTGASPSSSSGPSPSAAQSPILPSGIVPRDVEGAAARSSVEVAVEEPEAAAPAAPPQLPATAQTDEHALQANATEQGSGMLEGDAGMAFEIEMNAGSTTDQQQAAQRIAAPQAAAHQRSPQAPRGQVSGDQAPRGQAPGRDRPSRGRQQTARKNRFDGAFDPNVGYDDGITAEADPFAEPEPVAPAGGAGLDGADDLFGGSAPSGPSAPTPGSFGEEADFGMDLGAPEQPAAPTPQPPQQQPPPPEQPQALVPLWDNVIDADYQFGAIPQLDLEEGESHTGELDLEGFDPDAHRELAQRPQGYIEAPGTEFELESGLEENVAYLIPGVVKQEYTDEEPAVIVSAQLATAQEAEDADHPDFAGQLGTRTVAKVLFRFGLVEESGLLTLTGPERGGAHAEHRHWLHELISDASKRNLPPLAEQHTCEVLLEEGQPRLMAADRSEESLITHLLANGHLEAEDVKVAVLANPHRSLVAALLAAGQLAPLQISRYVTSYVLDTVLATFSWSSGDFAFYRGRSLDHESFPTGMELPQLLVKGVGSMQDPALDDYFEQLRGSRVIPSQTPPTHIDAFAPDDLMLSVYRSIGRGYEVFDTIKGCAGYGDLTEVKRALYLLIECELAELA